MSSMLGVAVQQGLQGRQQDHEEACVMTAAQLPEGLSQVPGQPHPLHGPVTGLDRRAGPVGG